MSIFATEFPVDPAIQKADFVALTLSWIRGMQHSGILEEKDSIANYDDEVTIEAANGESLSMREVGIEDGFVVGARHEIPDRQGRLWRTECTLTHRNSEAYLRVRGQCLGTVAGAVIATPKKPFLIKEAIREKWGVQDGLFPVSDKPIHLQDGQLEVASIIIRGDTRASLPILYVSRTNADETWLDCERLAFDLGGVAHVVVEPSRAFSFKLMDECGGANPYGGTIGICIEGKGVVRRFYLGGLFATETSLADAIKKFVVELVSSRNAAKGWEWQELQEEQAKLLRAKLSDNNQSDYIVLLEQEIEAKEETIQNLKTQNQKLREDQETSLKMGEELLAPSVAARIGEPLFEGEFSDRLFVVLRDLLDSPGFEIDDRSKEVIRRVVERYSLSGNAKELQDELKSASTDSRNGVGRTKTTLRRLGFTISTDGKHGKATPSDELFGVRPITIANTPSDWRSLKNAVSQIMGAMALTRLLK